MWPLGLPGLLPSEASAAANSAFAWVYVLSIVFLKERVDYVKVLAVSLVIVCTVEPTNTFAR